MQSENDIRPVAVRLRMLQLCNIARRLAQSVVYGTLALASPTLAQSAPDLPGPGEALAAWQTLDSWVREWRVPAEPQAVDPPGARGAMVTLRLAGRILGRGAHMSEDGQSLWRAARDAWTSADAAMPFERDALREQNIRDAAQRIQIELQFAGLLTPLLGETYDVAAASLSPGVHGVAARVGPRIEAIFPGTALATGASPVEALRAAVGKLGLAPLELGKLVSGSGLAVYRFDARALAQREPGAPPEFTYRGGRIIHLPQVTGAALRACADALADHLLTRRWPGQEPHGLLGDYHPLTDRYDPLIASPFAQALGAFALCAYADTPGAAPERAARARDEAARVLRELTRVAPDEADPLQDPLAAAMWLAAYRRASGAGSENAELAGFAEGARRAVEATFDAGRSGWTGVAPPVGRGLLAFAMALERAPGAEAAVRSVFRNTDRAGLVAELPWIGWAELEIARGRPQVPAAEALRNVRKSTWEFQVTETDAGTEYADMAGGIVFTRSRTPLPTWHSLRPLAFLATALGDPRLTSDQELRTAAQALRRSLRFVLQLTVNTDVAWMFRDAARCRGAVRAALWDQTCTLEASALGLLTVAETLRSTDARTGRPTRPENSEPTPNSDGNP